MRFVKLRYPTGRVDILILDDSTDGTSDLAAARVAFHAAAGVNIRLLKRRKTGADSRRAT